jgi:hypothetical protein
MPSDKQRERSMFLVQQAHSIRSQTDELHRRVVSAAEMIMYTEECVASTLARMAEDHPHRAARLKVLSQAAQANVVHERQWIADHTRDWLVVASMPRGLTGGPGRGCCPARTGHRLVR